MLLIGDLTQVDSQCSREDAGPKLTTPSTDVIPIPVCGTKIRMKSLVMIEKRTSIPDFS